MEKKLQKPYLTDYNLLTVQDSCETYHQILLVILLKKFIKLNVIMSMMIKNTKRAELNIKIPSSALNAEALKII